MCCQGRDNPSFPSILYILLCTRTSVGQNRRQLRVAEKNSQLINNILSIQLLLLYFILTTFHFNNFITIEIENNTKLIILGGKGGGGFLITDQVKSGD